MVAPWTTVLVKPTTLTGLMSTMLFVLMSSSAWAQARLANHQPLQTEVTQQDLALIDRLVQLALNSSADIRAAKAAMGVSAFAETVTLEVGPDFRTGSWSEAGEAYSGTENGFSLTFTLDPLQLISSIQQLPVLRSRLQETKGEKRVEVVKYYVAYLQAKQAVKIAAYQMQALAKQGDAPLEKRTPQIATRHLQSASQSISSLDNKEYVAAATEMLTASAQARVALEELAGCVGLSAQATLALLKEGQRE